MTTRPPRTHAHQKEQPDSAGRWWFQGHSLTGLTVTPVQHRPFEVITNDSGFVPTVPDTDTPYTESELIGWWTAEGDM